MPRPHRDGTVVGAADRHRFLSFVLFDGKNEERAGVEPHACQSTVARILQVAPRGSATLQQTLETDSHPGGPSHDPQPEHPRPCRLRFRDRHVDRGDRTGARRRIGRPVRSHGVLHAEGFELGVEAEARRRLPEVPERARRGGLLLDRGPRGGDEGEGINDQGFDVALHIVFRDKKSYDKYADAPRHKEFIEENKDSWKKVRVFDSWVAGK